MTEDGSAHERLVTQLAALHEDVLAAGKAFVNGDPGAAAAQLEDLVIFARDVAADLRRLAEAPA